MIRKEYVNSIIIRCDNFLIIGGWEHPIVGPRFINTKSINNKVLKIKRGIDNKSIPLPFPTINYFIFLTPLVKLYKVCSVSFLVTLFICPLAFNTFLIDNINFSHDLFPSCVHTPLIDIWSPS